jgi:hypothetical protein
MIYRTLIAGALLAGSAVGTTLSNSDAPRLKQLFEEFKTRFQKSYATFDDEVHRK